MKPVPATEKSVVVLIYLGLVGCFDEDLLHLLDGCSPVPPLTRVLAKEIIEESYKKGHLCSSYLIGALPFLLWQGSCSKRI